MKKTNLMLRALWLNLASPLLRTTLVLLIYVPLARSQGFSSGSDGSLGPLNVTANTNIVVPQSGVLNYTTITIARNITVRFIKNANNTPVHLLATGDVSIAGTINLDGASGNNTTRGESGPGGFNGGNPGSISVPSGAGYGPGGGRGGVDSTAPGGSGGGSYATVGTSGSSTNKGSTYGSALLVPLVGGSGGGGTDGTPGTGGGGGGGAILIASSTRIDHTGSITAIGGNRNGSSYNSGSGGAIRLVAPIISGSGSLLAYGSVGAGDGRIRIDTLNRTGIGFTFNPVSSTSIGSMMMVFPTPLPRLDIIEAAGTAIPSGSGPVFVQLPFGSSPNREVKIQASNFNDTVPITVVLTPDNGSPVSYRAEIDNRSSNPATASVNVTIPVNVQTAIDAWTR